MFFVPFKWFFITILSMTFKFVVLNPNVLPLSMSYCACVAILPFMLLVLEFCPLFCLGTDENNIPDTLTCNFWSSLWSACCVCLFVRGRSDWQVNGLDELGRPLQLFQASIQLGVELCLCRPDRRSLFLELSVIVSTTCWSLLTCSAQGIYEEKENAG